MYSPETEKYKPWPKTREEFDGLITTILTESHDYNTSAEAITDASVAVYNFVASELGCTGFQASWARLKFMQRAAGIEGPFMLVKLEDAVYPQYDLPGRVQEFINENKEWLRERALERIEDAEKNPEWPPHPEVLAHWQKLVDDA
jgi:hypothetical protein